MPRGRKSSGRMASLGFPNPIDVHVGQRIRQRRTLLGMSQEKLGEAIGLTFQQVQKYERGANRVGSSRLFDLARVLDVPVTYFFDEMSSAHGGEVAVTPARPGRTEARAVRARSACQARDAGAGPRLLPHRRSAGAQAAVRADQGARPHGSQAPRLRAEVGAPPPAAGAPPELGLTGPRRLNIIRRLSAGRAPLDLAPPRRSRAPIRAVALPKGIRFAQGDLSLHQRIRVRRPSRQGVRPDLRCRSSMPSSTADPEARVACETLVHDQPRRARRRSARARALDRPHEVDWIEVGARTPSRTSATSRTASTGSTPRSRCYLHAQSADIAQGVDAAGNKDEGAGDQGIMFGYRLQRDPSS